MIVAEALPVETLEGVVVGTIAGSGRGVLVWLGSKQVIALTGHPDRARLTVEDIVRVRARPDMSENEHDKLSRGVGRCGGGSVTLQGPTIHDVRAQLMRLGTHMFRRYNFVAQLEAAGKEAS